MTNISYKTLLVALVPFCLSVSACDRTSDAIEEETYEETREAEQAGQELERDTERAGQNLERSAEDAAGDVEQAVDRADARLGEEIAEDE